MARGRVDTLHIKTLGGLSIKRDGQVVGSFASRKAEALLVYLACNPRSHPREVLADLLWDDRPQRQAMANLRVVLSSLRKEVGAHVAITRTTAAIAADAALKLDVDELETAVSRLRAGDARDSSDSLDEIIAGLHRYEGDFLAGFFLPDASGFETWATVERERLHRLFLDALQRLGNWYLKQRDFAEAIATSSRLLELEPLAEAGHRTLMEALARDGQRGQALASYEALAQALAQELGVEPANETEELVAAIRAGHLAASVAAPVQLKERRYHLPLPATPLIGRERELAEVRELLAGGTSRLVSIVAPGGMGKTRLALEVAHNLAEHFDDRAAFVNLAPLSAVESLVSTVAQALRFDLQSEGGRDAERQLLDYLRPKELLLVLDNFEHLLDAAPLLTEIVRAAPAVKLLVTSRERLKLQVEQVYPLHGLALRSWQTIAEAHEDPAIQLFLHHAQRVQPSFALRPEDLEPLPKILRLLGGMPLGIIMAAGWVGVLSPVEIAAEIGHSLDTLEAMDRDLPPRHRSMRAVFDVTWQRLAAREREHFAAISVFRGGFALQAARAVVGASARGFLQLVDRSLLTRVEGGRFEIHELLRQFAAEQLAASPEQEEAVRRKHAQFYCAFLQRWGEELDGPLAMEAEAEIAADRENIRRAWMWAANNEEALIFQAQKALATSLSREGRPKEAEAAFLYAVDRLTQRDTIDARGMAELLALASHYTRLRSPTKAETLMRRAHTFLTAAEERGQDARAQRAFVLFNESLLSSRDGQAQALLEESLTLYQELGLRKRVASTHYELGWAYYEQSNYQQSLQHWRQALHLAEKIGNRSLAARTRAELAMISARTGRLAEAETHARELVALRRAEGSERGIAHALYVRGEVLILCGRFGKSLDSLMECQKLFAMWDTKMVVRVIISYRRWAELHLGHYATVARAAPRLLLDDRELSEHPEWERGMAHFLQGCAALALNRPDEARAHLDASAATFRLAFLHDEGAWAEAALACVHVHQHDLDAARDRLRGVLQTASDRHLFWPVVHALPAVALLLAEWGDSERAVELLALASRHDFVANSRWFAAVAGQRIAAAATLPAENAAAAIARGEAADLWQVVDQLVRELAARPHVDTLARQTNSNGSS